MSTALTSIIISYLLGSIPSGVIITKCFNLGEIRNIGSGSTGATNVLRTGNYLASALTLFFDVLKDKNHFISHTSHNIICVQDLWVQRVQITRLQSYFEYENR